jgi:hypothetical protein
VRGEATPAAKNKLTGEQCEALRKLLEREKQFGTRKAAAMSQISYPYRGNDLLLKPFNSSYVPNLIMNNGDELDLDWWSTLRALTTDSGELAFTKYAAGKSIWSIVKMSRSGNPIPFTDPGERHAVELSMAGSPFSDVFDKAFMDRECPQK